MADEKLKKIKPNADCKKGNHNFLVTQWFKHGSHEKAMHMRCSNCLMMIDLEQLHWLEQGAQDDVQP